MTLSLAEAAELDADATANRADDESAMSLEERIEGSSAGDAHVGDLGGSTGGGGNASVVATDVEMSSVA